jgi:hypothetical protein
MKVTIEIVFNDGLREECEEMFVGIGEDLADEHEDFAEIRVLVNDAPICEYDWQASAEGQVRREWGYCPHKPPCKAQNQCAGRR